MQTPKMISYQTTEATREYLYRLVELGAVEGNVGQMSIHPEMNKLLDAAHHVLAGGKVDVRVVKPGNVDVHSDLATRITESMRQVNEANAAGGTYVTATP